MYAQYLFSVLAIAGIAVIWRNHLERVPSHKEWIKRVLPVYFAGALTCGSCFTYWTAFCFVLIADPLTQLKLSYRFSAMHARIFDLPFRFLLSWMTLSMSAVFLRFLYVLIQEKVSSLVHAPHGLHR